MKRGLLLINLGTPEGTKVSEIRRFLRQFLTDKRVIDLPAPLRYLLVYFFILPFKAKKSSQAYQSIWNDEGSPLLYHSLRLKNEVQKKMATECQVELGLRYSKPSIEQALMALGDCESITVLPLYPHYSSAATGSAIESFLNALLQQKLIPSIRIIHDFYKTPSYINALAQLIQMHHKKNNHLLFSYHGIPERQLIQCVCKQLKSDACPAPRSHTSCYKSKCLHSSQLIAQALHLTAQQYSSSFQSRLGKTPWIQPYTDDELVRLASLGIKNLTVVCPSFVSDCVETLEEIGIRAKNQWIALGGEELSLVPSLNTHPLWIDAIINLYSET